MATPLNILVTGGTGYIGRNLIPPLIARGHRVRVLARQDSVARVSPGAAVVIGNALDDQSVDAGLSTFTLCTIPDVSRALSEVHRVLRPGGTFHFLEHGLCPEPGVARRQHRFNGIQQRLAGGCHLDRPIDALIGEAGFEFVELDHDQMPGPKFMLPWGYLYEGVARKSS